MLVILVPWRQRQADYWNSLLHRLASTGQGQEEARSRPVRDYVQKNGGQLKNDTNEWLAFSHPTHMSKQKHILVYTKHTITHTGMNKTISIKICYIL